MVDIPLSNITPTTTVVGSDLLLLSKAASPHNARLLTVSSLATYLGTVLPAAEWAAGSVTTLGTGLSLVSGTLSVTITSDWHAGVVNSLGTGVGLSAGVLSGDWKAGVVNSLVGAAVSAGVLTSNWHAAEISAVGTGLTIGGTTLSLSASLDNLSDVIITTPTSTQVITYNGSNWVNGVLAYASLSGKPTIPSALDDLSDVTITTPADGNTLRYNGALWVNAVLAYADISGKPVLATVATTGAYADLTGKPSLATVATSGLYADLLSKPTFATVATTGVYSDLTGKPTLVTALSGLSDVTLTSPVSGNLLTYSGSAWVNTKLAFDLSVYYPSVPTASAVIFANAITRAVNWAANFANSYFFCTVATTAAVAIDVKLAGSTIGTISFGVGATTATFTTVGGTAKSASAGQSLTFVAPVSPDATFAGFYGTLYGTRTS